MNDADRHLMTIFTSALDHEAGADRDAYLDGACAADPALRARVEGLLRAHEHGGRFLEPTQASPYPAGDVRAGEPAGDATGAWAGPPISAGSVIAGRYKLLEPIGEGGMGSVWMAQQTEPVKRLVAVKLIKSGLDSKQVLARFEAERQALALMDHPNIARVYDGGMTGVSNQGSGVGSQGSENAGLTPDSCLLTPASGRPFFVMELVKGVPITKYCDEQRLTPRARLELFAPVCHAIQHAHQKGVIHRDIKPSNVLVALYDDRPVPKVIDFGVAKATGQQLSEHTLHTGFGAVVGTVEYMSPEQASFNQLDVDTRSDIYSLGVLLYELLAGSPPFTKKDLEKAGVLEMLRVIREQEPSKPSAKLSTADGLPALAAKRGTEPAKLTKLVRGELDWIVMKALDKDRSRRYATANGFAADVQRYLADEPVQACPPSAGYRLRKFVARNRGPVLAASVILMLLIGGIVGTTLGLLQAQKSEEHAQDEAFKAGQERDEANKARVAEKKQRNLAEERGKLAEERGKELRQSLYYAEMNLAGHAADSNAGLPQVAERLSHWGSDQFDVRGWEWFYLHGLCHPEALTIGRGAGSIAWSPDGRCVAVYESVAVKVWDAVTGKQTIVLWNKSGEGDSGPSIAWSPDGALLASGGGRGIITIWELAAGKQLLTFQAHTGCAIRALAWASNGKHLASAGDDGTIKVWEAKTGKGAFTLKGDTAPVLAVGWSRDGKRLASVDSRGTAKIWDEATRNEAINLQTGLQPGAAAWNPDCKVAIVSGDNRLQIWDMAGAKPLALANRRLPLGGTRALAWRPDGKRLARGTHEGDVEILDAATGNVMSTLSTHSADVRAIAWNPDGTRLASRNGVDTLILWDAEQKGSLAKLHNNVPDFVIPVSVAWSPGGKRLASGNHDGTVTIWDTTSAQILTLKGHTAGVYSLAWGPDGTRLASASASPAIVKVWDTVAGKEVFSTSGLCVAWNPNDGQLASAEGNDTVKIWNTATRELTRTLTSTGFVGAISWDPQGIRLAGAGGALWIWDSAARLPTRTFKGHRARVNSVAWCPSGKRLATGSGDGDDRTIKIWDSSTGAEVLTLKGHTGEVTSVAWSPDGTRLASASLDKTVRLWDPVTGKEVISFRIAACGVVWSPDGLRLALGSNFITMIMDATNGYRLAGVSPPGGNSKPGAGKGILKP